MFLLRTGGNLRRNFKSVALAPHDFAVRSLMRSSHALLASTASLSPTSVTIAKRPSFKGRGRRDLWI